VVHPANESKPELTAPIALVFADVAGAARKRSAGAALAQGDDLQADAVQSRYLRLVRDSLRGHGGKEVMTVGDSFFLTFDDPRSALLCCAEMQMRLKSTPIMTDDGPMQMRMGIHCGRPQFFENSWHGTDVDTAARVESVASSGQIIVSDAARALMGELPGVPLHPLGTFALRGVGEVVLWDADFDLHGPRKPLMISQERRRRWARMRVLRRWSIGAGAACLALAGWLDYRQQQRDLLTVKDKLVLAQPTNETGESIFDETLKQALTVQLEQSPLLQLVSNGELSADLLFLHHPPEEAITPALARQLGQREGYKAYIAATLSRRGKGYLISIDSVNCATGSVIAHAEAKSDDQNQVLKAVSTASGTLRRKLGESLATVEKLSTPFTEVTTTSLEAFHAYSLGEAAHLRSAESESVSFYKQAVQLDPNFAMAYARLGVTYLNLQQVAKATMYLTKAYALRERATERERLYIAAQLAYAKGNLPQAISVYRDLLQAYPLDSSGLNNTGLLYQQAGDNMKAANYLEKSVENAPWNVTSKDNLSGALLAVDGAAQARQYLEQSAAVSKGTDSNLLQNQAEYAFETGDSDWRRYLVKADTLPDGFILAGSESDINYVQGDRPEARKYIEHAALLALHAKAADAAGSYFALASRYEAMLGDCGQAVTYAKKSLTYDDSAETLPDAAVALAMCGAGAEQLVDLHKLADAAPENTLLNAVYVPEVEAAMALAQHRPEAVAGLLAQTDPFALASLAPIFEAEAYLELQRPADALKALAPALKYRFEEFSVGQSPSYSYSMLLAARAHAMAGDKKAAMESYQRLEDLWRNADPGLKPLVEAKREMAALASIVPSSSAPSGSAH
jgi:class 3 adenylate cyclase/tetratricopeptide (TPR) repeat protein